jgi:hypothetical protein
MRSLCSGVLTLICVGAAQSPKPIDPKYAPLAQQLFTAGEAERGPLLASHPEFANPTLIVTINEIAGRFYDRSDFEHALPMFETARAVARQLQDRPGAANSQHDIGSRFGGGHAHRARGRESAVRFGGMAQ